VEAHGGGSANQSGTLSLQRVDQWQYCHTNSTPSDGSGAVTSQGHNLISYTNEISGLIASDLENVSANLGPLQDNGGFGPTHALLLNSPALDAGDNTGAPATDQRGVARPQGTAVDIGAFELPPVSILLDGLHVYRRSCDQCWFAQVTFQTTSTNSTMLYVDGSMPRLTPLYGAVHADKFGDDSCHRL
jgi:hypothetical protein